ncbi:amidohydrolase family protein [Vibrio sp. SS-MA-C1-2]|uniref:N-acetylglucosamine-6-phosphate deacetylase n=1 Tax=Vibrio sp. SS-MA-C1-2 TaxID=2908646 RepID=UPI001F477DC7|nr:amidohydrolase family protein [Vibrio sp. SS-MA-C1-2]UJF18270.1 amidohydrolase family protein [Vibrio sp. SS-MA-C1-2]
MILTGKTFKELPIKIYCNDGLITKVETFETDDLESLPIIAPGMVDLQVNGYAGVDYNTLPLNDNELLHSAYQLFSKGVTSFCPTIITNSDDNISSLILDLNRIKNSDKTLSDAIVGYHLEGPFISPKDGPRGAHNLNYVQAPNVELIKKWNTLSEGALKILTLSPEWDLGLDETINYCTNNNIKVAIGHSAASPDQIHRAVNLGASMSTHLGNGCELQIHRHHNYIWQQLAEDDLWSGVIADGFHLPATLLKVILRAKKGKVFVTSDTTAFGGMDPGSYITHIGGEVILTEEGKLHLASNPELLAGSAQSTLDCVNFLIESELCTPSEAWDLVSLNPAKYMGFNQVGSIEKGKLANLVVLNKNKRRLEVKQTIIAGDVVYTA